MKHRYCFLSFFIIISFFSFSQESNQSEQFLKNHITKPNILSTHTFGVYFSRIQGNFKSNAPKNKVLAISIESGNVWNPAVKTYIPKDEATRQVIRSYNWDQAHTAFDESIIDKDSFNIKNDGVIKGFKFNLSLKIAKKHEIQIGLRTFLLTKGKSPFSILTGDKFIEKFHENIAGGDDAFDRRDFPRDQAYIEYSDRYGNVAEVKSGQLFATGIETNYFYYPESLKNKANTFAINFGAHLGTNLSRSNSSLDFGVSINAIKTFPINTKSNLNIGTSIGTLKKGVLDFKSNNVDFGNNEFIGYSETALEYSFKTKKGTVHTFGANFYLQSRLNKKDELEYIIPIRDENAYNAWGHGVTNLYKNNNYWTFIYSFTRKVTTTLYIQQDFTVNNNPDLQTGIGLSFSI